MKVSFLIIVNSVVIHLFWKHTIISLTVSFFFLCVQNFNESQRILERQRFQFPANWLYSDNIEGEWGAFSDIMKRKDSSIQTQVASLQMKIVSEDKIVESKTHDMLSEWEKEKPIEVKLFEYTFHILNASKVNKHHKPIIKLKWLVMVNICFCCEKI